MSAFAALRTATRSARLTRATIPNRVAALSSSRIGVAAARRFYSSDEKSAGESSGSAATEAEGKKGDAAALTEEQKLLAAKDAEILDLTSRLRYATADFQNLQRISEREKTTAKEFAITRFAKDLLSTADVLSLALKSVPQSALVPPESGEADAPNARLIELYKGVELTQRQLAQTLAAHGVKAYDPLGEKFDPNRHEALYQAPAPPGTEPGTIIDVQKVGYTIKDRTLRAPQVGVAQET